MSINRRKALRVLGQGLVALSLPTENVWSAQAQAQAAAPSPANRRSANTNAAEGASQNSDEEEKKSSLVDDTEQFGRGRTRVALLLPSINGPYRFAADAVLRGVMAAHKVDGSGVYVKVVRLEDEQFGDADKVYRQLQRDRFQQVIGPLIRSEINGLGRLRDLPIPTLGLNLPDREHNIPTNCVLFSLAIEYDGRSAAQFAFADLYQRIGTLRPIRALAISDTSELSRRAADAFLEGWRALGGEVEPPIVRDVTTEDEMRSLLVGVRADIVFVAFEPELLKEIRAAFSAQLPIYGTSQLNVGAIPAIERAAAELLASPELDGVRVVEMPWQLEPRHPAVAAYPRSRRLPHVEMQRLYAFGIDAWRLAREMLNGVQQISLDGVTGQLFVDRAVDARVSRDPLLGEYRQGILMPAYASPYDQSPPAASTSGRPASRPPR